MAKLCITWVKSSTGYARDQRETIKALGLHRLHHSVEHDDSPSIRGMIAKVKHLVHVEPKAQADSAGPTLNSPDQFDLSVEEKRE